MANDPIEHRDDAITLRVGKRYKDQAVKAAAPFGGLSPVIQAGLEHLINERHPAAVDNAHTSRKARRQARVAFRADARDYEAFRRKARSRGWTPSATLRALMGLLMTELRLTLMRCAGRSAPKRLVTDHINSEFVFC